MPTAVPPTLSEDDADDLLFLSRTGETSDLRTEIEKLSQRFSTSPTDIIAVAIDRHSGNGLLHMASANGHTGTLKGLLSLSSPSSTFLINLQNSSGNTPLHWAALNGHLETVKVLVEAGTDVTVINDAGHDAIYAAEVNDKTEVAEWILTSGKGLEKGIAGRREEEEAVPTEESDEKDGEERKKVVDEDREGR